MLRRRIRVCLFLRLAETSEEDPTNTPLTVLTTRPFGLQGLILKILVGNTQLGAENSMPSGIPTKETTTTHDTMTTLASTGITGEIHMSRTSGSTATGNGRGRGRGNGSKLIGKETMNGDRLSGARAQHIPGARRALEHPPRSQNGCRATRREGFTAGLQIAVAAAAHCLLRDTTSLTKPVWKDTQKMRKWRKSVFLSRRGWTRRSAW